MEWCRSRLDRGLPLPRRDDLPRAPPRRSAALLVCCLCGDPRVHHLCGAGLLLSDSSHSLRGPRHCFHQPHGEAQGAVLEHLHVVQSGPRQRDADGALLARVVRAPRAPDLRRGAVVDVVVDAALVGRRSIGLPGAAESAVICAHRPL
eukprot:Amastigsp_a676706_75.p3 type:complete len:148 gc:universal Amastigsp_a676706_75:466-23(-)